MGGGGGGERGGGEWKIANKYVQGKIKKKIMHSQCGNKINAS